MAGAVGPGQRQKGDDQVHPLVALVGPVFDFFSHRVERAFGAALDHAAHRVRGRAIAARSRGCAGRCRGRCFWHGFQHRAQDAVGPVGGQPLEAGAPSLQVQVFEVGVGVIGRHVDGFGNRGVHVGLHRLHHGDVVLGAHFERADEIIGQIADVVAQGAVQPPGVVLHLVLAAAAVGLAFFAQIGPRKSRFDAVGGVVGKGQAHGAGGRDRQQVAVADAVGADAGLQLGWQAAGEGAGL